MQSNLNLELGIDEPCWTETSPVGKRPKKDQRKLLPLATPCLDEFAIIECIYLDLQMIREDRKSNSHSPL